MRGASGLVAIVAITAVAVLLLPATKPAGATGVGAIAGGGAHTCVVLGGGGAKCWGLNNSGQLGDGTTTNSTVPVDVSGLTDAAAPIALGDQHTCVLTNGGGVKCWGDNSSGQLGDGTTTSSTIPTDVSGLTSGVATITAGTSHACAVTSGGGVMCWGSNSQGQLGDGTTTDSTIPVDVSGLGSGVAAIAGGGLHTCALTDTGAVECWGFNQNGQLGNGTTTNSTTPVSVSGLSSGIAAIAVGGIHSCALTATGGVKCWGDNTWGQLGNGTTTNSPTPVNVIGLAAGVTAITGGFAHTCAIMTYGVVKCWGSNDFGSLGNGNRTSSSMPVNVLALGAKVAAIGAGAFHTCVIAKTAEVLCWGSNILGKQGNGTTADNLTPGNVTGFAAKSCPDLDRDATCDDVDPDLDGDRCPNLSELGPNQARGGQRDPYNPWDYFNPTHDGHNRTDDLFVIAQRYGRDNGDPLYSIDYDRTPLPGGHPWQFGPPDGFIRSADITAGVLSYGHDCS